MSPAVHLSVYSPIRPSAYSYVCLYACPFVHPVLYVRHLCLFLWLYAYILCRLSISCWTHVINPTLSSCFKLLLCIKLTSIRITFFTSAISSSYTIVPRLPCECTILFSNLRLVLFWAYILIWNLTKWVKIYWKVKAFPFSSNGSLKRPMPEAWSARKAQTQVLIQIFVNRTAIYKTESLWISSVEIDFLNQSLAEFTFLLFHIIIAVHQYGL